LDEQADFAAKLRQIEELALVAGSQLPDGPAKASFRQIVLIVKMLRQRLDHGIASISPRPHSGDKPPTDT
jgi:hypothetical protein